MKPEQVYPFLSYSSGSTLSECPKKFQLDRLHSIVYNLTRDPQHNRRDNNVTLSFGSALGEGVQAQLRGEGFNKSVLRAAMAWGVGLGESDGKKSIKTLVQALANFHTTVQNLGSEWETLRLVKPDGSELIGSELGITIRLPSCSFRLYIDVVMYNKINKTVVMVELKTSSAPKEETYKYSLQGTLYQLALMVLCKRYGILPENTTVNYQVFDTKQHAWTSMPFLKTKQEYQGAIAWLMAKDRELAFYSETNVFPQVGGYSTCMAFNRTCQFFNQCHHLPEHLLPLDVIRDDYLYDDPRAAKYPNMIEISLAELAEGAN